MVVKCHMNIIKTNNRIVCALIKSVSLFIHARNTPSPQVYVLFLGVLIERFPLESSVQATVHFLEFYLSLPVRCVLNRFSVALLE